MLKSLVVDVHWLIVAAVRALDAQRAARRSRPARRRSPPSGPAA